MSNPASRRKEPGRAQRATGLSILHVLNHTYRLNGNVHAAVDLACAQAALGHRVSVCSAGGSFDALMRSSGVETIVLDQARRPGTLVKAAAGLVRLVRDGGYDVVHAHMMTSALLAWPACRVAGVPLVTTVHNAFQRSAILMAIGTRMIAVSDAVGRSMASRGAPASRLRVVLNGTIGTARREGRSGVAKPLGSPALVFVGGLHPRKGVGDLLAAFARVHREHPSARLTLVGEGPDQADYEAAVASSGHAEAVTFAGAVDDPNPYLLGADILVLPSHADPAPLVLSEAREAGCAIVASAVDGIPELLEGGAAGLLVPPRDPERLAAALLSLLSNGETLATWRRNSQINIDRLRIDRVARDTLAVYGECVRARAEDGKEEARLRGDARPRKPLQWKV